MNATCPALPEPSLATWSRTARPVRLLPPVVPRPLAVDARTPLLDDTDTVDDLMFGASAAVLMALPLIVGVAALVG